jgi:lanthanide-dependent methanol dehydrogenase
MPFRSHRGRIEQSLLPSGGANRLLATVVALLVVTGCPGDRPDDGRVPPAERRGEVAAIHLSLDQLAADDGQWVMAPKDYASTRFSSLSQINTENVSGLQLAWTFSTGRLRGHEAAPIVVGTTMYVVTPHPNDLYALDIRDGALLWHFQPGTDDAAQGVACCDVVNRGAAYADGMVIFNTLDNHTIAVDAATGVEVWRNRLGDINIGESMTMAPLVVRDKVLVGNSGGEFGVRGWITALNLADGSIAWRAYSTGPDSEVLIGDRFNPFYEQDRGADLGVTTWPPEMWRLGGGTVWGWISYDPELNLIYHGTGNPGSWNPALRPGDNKWSSALFARDPDTGEAVWAYQFVPHDEHDYDAINENVLVDLPIGGQMRQVLIRPERNGFVYIMDRATGQVLSADPFGTVTWAFGIDLETGRPIKNEAAATGNRLARNVCPAAPGMKDFQPSAYSPRTRLLYMPHNHICMDYEGIEANYVAGTPYIGANVVIYPAPGDGHRGKFTAWDPVERRIVWQIDEWFPVWSGAVATAGDVVFYGTMDRLFKAVHAQTGELLWQFRTGSGVIGQPVTYSGPDGRQYVAVLAGVGGWAGIAALGVRPDLDPFIGLGFPNAMRDLPAATAEGGTLYVFALP